MEHSLDTPQPIKITPELTHAHYLDLQVKVNRVEAKIDAMAARQDWIVNTVTEFVNAMKQNPMAGMFAKRNG